jgi:predicted chitinase
MGRLTADKFINFFRYYQGLPHQDEAITELWRMMPVSLLEDEADWIYIWRDPAVDEEEEDSGICTPRLMEKLTGYKASAFDQAFCNDCNRLFRETGFSSHPKAMQMLMANMMHETANFKFLKEIASGHAYEGRADLGNHSPGDGPRYKGAGVLMTTGAWNYRRLADAIGDDRVMEGVEYVANTYPFTSARVWIEENNLLSVCLTQGFDQCCLRINGGWNGYDDRLRKYRICQKYMR